MPRQRYLGGRQVQQPEQRYLGDRQQTSTTTRYTGGEGPVNVTSAQKKSDGGGGLLGELKKVGHYVGQKAEAASRDIKGAPGGILDQLEVGVVHPWVDALTTGHVSKKHTKQIDKLIQDTADSTAATLNHPLRDPFATALLVSPALHGAGRVATGAARAGGALSRGEGVAAAAKAAADRSVKPRSLHVGGKDVPLVPSKNPTVRAGQHVYDKTLQRALNKKPQGRVAAHAQKRVGGALKEEARIQQKQRAVPADLLDKSAMKLSKRPGRRREEQAALELTSVQTTPAEAVAYHERQAAKGVNPEQNRAVAKLYQRVADRGLLTEDPAGHVIVNPEHEQLSKADARLARVQLKGDQTLVEKGVRSREALQARVDAPGRIRAGAEYRKYQPSDLFAKQHLSRYTKEDVAAGLQAINRVHGLRHVESPVKVTESDNLGNATARTISYRDGALVIPHEVQVTRGGTKVPLDFVHEVGHVLSAHLAPADVARVVKAAKHTRAYALLEKTKNPAYAQSERELFARAYAQWIARRGGDESLRRSLRAHFQIGPRWSNKEFAPIARALSRAFRDFKGAGLVGGEDARPGRGFVSARVSEKKLSKAEASAARGPVVGVARSPIDSKTFTGRSIEQGLVPKNVTGSASRHFRQIVKFVNTDAMRRAALQTGSDVRRSNRDVLVRDPDVPAEKLGPTIQQQLGRETAAVDTAEDLATQEGLKAAHEAFVESLFRPGELRAKFAGDRSQAIGTEAPAGYKWVDKGALGDVAAPPKGPPTRIGRAVDNVNSAVTAATVYFKVGHVGTRVLTNAATNIIQGSATPKQIKYGVQLWHALGDEEKARALAAAGQHGFAALPHEGAGKVGAVASKGAAWWARHADAPFRFNSLAYEARKAGYDTPAKFKAFLDHLESGGQGLPAHEWAKVSAAGRAADREAIAYDRLNEFEKRYLTRAFWFYPWIKGATLFSVRTAIEHPYKTAYLAASGQHGRQVQEQRLGPTPSYEAGLIGLGGGSHPFATDFSTFSPFATAADLLNTAANRSQLADQFNPALGAAGQFAYGLAAYGGTSQSPIIDALQAVGSPTPEQQLAEAYAAQHQDQSGRLFHKTLLNTLARYGAGPALPRRVNRNELAAAAARDVKGNR